MALRGNVWYHPMPEALVQHGWVIRAYKSGMQESTERQPNDMTIQEFHKLQEQSGRDPVMLGSGIYGIQLSPDCANQYSSTVLALKVHRRKAPGRVDSLGRWTPPRVAFAPPWSNTALRIELDSLVSPRLQHCARSMLPWTL